MMSRTDQVFHVIKRRQIVGAEASTKMSGSFTSIARAEAFIKTEILGFPDHGSAPGQWWCRPDENTKIDYWLVNDVEWRSQQRQLKH